MSTPSYYLVTDACTGEHLGFPLPKLIECHLKIASNGPEWPAVAIMATQLGEWAGADLKGFWQALLPGGLEDCRTTGSPIRAVKLLQVGKE